MIVIFSVSFRCSPTSENQTSGMDMSNQETMFEIFAKLPVHVFQRHTNIKGLIVDKYKNKTPKMSNFQISQIVKEYHGKLLQPDKRNGLLKYVAFRDQKYAIVIFVSFSFFWRNVEGVTYFLSSFCCCMNDFR